MQSNSSYVYSLWTAHKIISIDSNGYVYENRSFSSDNCIFMFERSDFFSRETDSRGVLMHELNHQFGAPDHYHELADPNNKNSCKNKSICSVCGDEPRSATCIMNKSRINISNDNVICQCCKNDMEDHMNIYNKPRG